MDPGAMEASVAVAIRRHLKQLRKVRPEPLLARRYKKYRAMGVFHER
jgi:acetyl-CoA carboxylase alpha subunit